MLVGDTHGNTNQMEYFCALAGERKIQKILVMGDFGLWTHFYHGVRFLDDIQRFAEGNNLSIFALGGNHENWDHWNWMLENMPTAKGFAYVRERVLIAPRAHQWKWANRTLTIAGGAVSIDKDWRLTQERGGFDGPMSKWFPGTGEKTLWWPNEQFDDDDMLRIKQFDKSDYLFTHDCSDYTPFQGRLKPDMDSQMHRQKIDEVLRVVRPSMHFHGHMHTKYDWVNTLGSGAFGSEPEIEIQTYGLEADFDAMHGNVSSMKTLDNWGVLDLETDTFAFKGEGMQFRSLDK